MREIARPLVPALEFLPGAQRVEQNEIVQPPGIFRAEIFKAAQRIACGRAQKVPRRFKQQRHFLRENLIVFDPGRKPTWR